ACYRRWEQSQAELQAVQQAHADAIGRVGTECTSLLEGNIRRYTDSSIDLARFREHVSDDIARHKRLVKRLCDDCEETVKEYRAAYLAHPAHAAHSLPMPPVLETGEEFRQLDELDLARGEADRIIARLSRLSHETARQLSLYIVTSQEQVPHTFR